MLAAGPPPEPSWIAARRSAWTTSGWCPRNHAAGQPATGVRDVRPDGHRQRDAAPARRRPVHTTALDFLRGHGLTGAKEGCAEGECGACSVLVARARRRRAAAWTAINACLVPAAALDGQEVVTAEGLGTPDDLHPVQRELAERGGSQCGYCTPGLRVQHGRRVLPAATGDRHRRPRARPNGFDLHALSGNLCRCTGYRPIRDAAVRARAPDRRRPARRAARRSRRPPPSPTRSTATARSPGRPTSPRRSRCSPSTRTPTVARRRHRPRASRSTCAAPRPPYVVAVDRLPELRELVDRRRRDRDRRGADAHRGRGRRSAGAVPLLDEVLPQFASRLIRNGATIGGNLGTASPIGDLPPALLALDATRRPGLGATASGRCRSPTTSPATARPRCGPAS